jgi:aquaporin Z
MTPMRCEQAGSTPEQRMVYAAAPLEFLETVHEWRRLFSEAWGTFLLAVVAAGCRINAPLSNSAYEGVRKIDKQCSP